MISFKRIFLTIFLPIVLALCCFFYFQYIISYKNIENALLDTLKNEWEIINAFDIKDIKSETTHNILKEIAKNTTIRITFIDTDGVVLNDTAIDYGNISQMQNHKEREEIRSALFGSPSFSIRKSATLNAHTVYYAKITNNGNILRLSYNISHIIDVRKTMKNEMVILLAFLLTIVGIVSAFLARKFSLPIKKLDGIANKISKNSGEFHFPEFKDDAINNIASVIYNTYSNLLKEKATAISEREKLGLVFSAMNEGIILLDSSLNIEIYNRKSEELLGVKLKNIKNIIGNIEDTDIIVFIKEASEVEGEEQKRTRFKDKIFDVYSHKTKSKDTLIVFGEVTEKAQYEAFKTELVGNITHEIKTPLAFIMGASETILSDDAMPEGTKRKFLETVLKNTKKLNDIVNETLELHKLEAQKGFRYIDNKSEINEAVEDAKASIIDTNGKEIIYNIQNASVGIRSQHISSVLSNLINNAIKYSKGTKIYIGIFLKENRLKIAVADEGPVIIESERPRIFERFYTVSKSRTRSTSGSGLGLAIVKHIADQYGGKASVYPNEYSGNTFEVTLYEKQIRP